MSKFNFSIAFVFMVVGFRFESAQGTKVLTRRQNAVFPIVGSEDFYVRVKKKIPVTYVDDEQLGHLRDYDYSNESDIDYKKYTNLDPPYTQQISTKRGQSVDLEAKSIICFFIFDSPFFGARGEVAVNYNLTQTETMNKLRDSNRDSYDDIYGNYPNADGQWLNPYKRRVVSVGGERFEEHTFRCLARRRKSETAAADSYVDYFVSPIYESKSPKDLIMKGRFVFTRNKDNELILIATAEERVSKMNIDLIREVHQYYYHANMRGDEYPKPDKASNELCSLTVRDKMRLCDSVINFPKFPDHVTFLPSAANVKHECEEVKVSGVTNGYYDAPSFFKSKKEITITIDITYDQWMVGCKVGSTGDDLPASSSWYYISVGPYRHTAMVFKESTTKNVYVGCIGAESVWWVERESVAVPISYKVAGKSSISVF